MNLKSNEYLGQEVVEQLTNKMKSFDAAVKELEVYRDFISEKGLRDKFKLYLEGLVEIGTIDKEIDTSAEESLLEEIEEEIEMDEYAEELENGRGREYSELSHDKLNTSILQFKELVTQEQGKYARKIYKRILNELLEEQIHRAVAANSNLVEGGVK
jgi:hypothetical protein